MNIQVVPLKKIIFLLMNVRKTLKKTEISTITNVQVKTIEQLLNDRTVRKFNYKTAKQVLLEKIALIT